LQHFHSRKHLRFPVNSLLNGSSVDWRSVYQPVTLPHWSTPLCCRNAWNSITRCLHTLSEHLHHLGMMVTSCGHLTHASGAETL
jgi:hypothetical protein